VVQLHHRRGAFEAVRTRVLVIGFEPAERAQVWMRQAGITFPFLLDPDRSVYRAYALERSFFRSWHPRNLWFYFKRLLRGGSLPKIQADPNQLGGDFLIDPNGRIRLAYYSDNATDRPSVEAVLHLLRNPAP
jgi:peroxiredoxin